MANISLHDTHHKAKEAMQCELNVLLKAAEQAQLKSREVEKYLTELLIIGEQTLLLEHEAVQQMNIAKTAFQRLETPLLCSEAERLSNLAAEVFETEA